jgi:glucokinase
MLGRMILAGDIGGTKTILGLFSRGADRPERVAFREFTTLAHASLGAMVREFVKGRVAPREIESAAFGVAGVVRGDIARLTNVPWVVDSTQIVHELGIKAVALLNDLQAMAYGVPALHGDELAVLQEGEAQPDGNAALIAAGTGLGEALLHNVNGRFLPSPSEGGHADFAARTPREIELLQELTRTYGRVDYEQVASGLGLINLYRFTHEGRRCPAIGDDTDSSAIAPRLTASAMAGRCADCMEALDIFVSVYGAEAGNLALRCVATAGVYVGGGIAPKILPALESGLFLDAFRDKTPMSDLLASIPVYVILNPEAGLLGAAVYANSEF